MTSPLDVSALKDAVAEICNVNDGMRVFEVIAAAIIIEAAQCPEDAMATLNNIASIAGNMFSSIEGATVH